MTVDLRGRRGRGWTLLTPANRYVSRLPHLAAATSLVKLVTPRFAGARFGQYLVELPAGAGTSAACDPAFEDFVYVLDGEVETSAGDLRAGGFAYVPEGHGLEFAAAASGPARLLWLKRRYESWPGVAAPAALSGHRDDEPFEPLGPGFSRRELLPADDPAFDFTMSLLRFEPGAALDRVEIHDEEHGLYMTAGEGLYYLDGERVDVCEGDFIHMAPYCPQTFVASGTEPAEYLLYKDVWRDGF